MMNKVLKKMVNYAVTGMMMGAAMFGAVPALNALAAYEVEYNDTPAQANTLPLNTWMTGAVNDPDCDWYKIVIPQRGVTRIVFKPNKNNTSTNSSWSFTLQDEDRNEISYRRGASMESSLLGLIPGTYYLRVSDYYTNETQQYDVCAQFQTTQTWEMEQIVSKKNPSNATTVGNGVTYSGTLYCSADVDYYYLPLNGENTVKVDFAMDLSVSNAGSWRIKVLEGSTMRELANEVMNTNRGIEVTTSGGGVYVLVSNYYAATEKMYHITVTGKKNAAVQSAAPAITQTVQTQTENKPVVQTPVTVKKTSISKITAGKRKATLKWKKVSGATGYLVYRSTKANTGYKKIANVKGKISYTDKKNLKSKKKYYYKVVAYKTVNGRTVKAAASSAKAIKIK